MDSLRPGEQFPISRQLEDHLDTDTYYMRAVARWADTDAIVPINGQQFLNLTDYGNKRFKGLMDVPADKSGGQGSYLAITTSVYTDAGYTTKADNYGDKEVVYLVFDRRNPYQGMGGGGASVDYKKVRAIVREENQKVVAEHLTPILNALTGLGEAIAAIQMPDIPEVNLEPVMQYMRTLETLVSDAKDAMVKAVASIEFPEQEKVDLAPLAARIELLKPDEFQDNMDALLKRMKDFFVKDIETLIETSSDTKKSLDASLGRISAFFHYLSTHADDLRRLPLEDFIAEALKDNSHENTA